MTSVTDPKTLHHADPLPEHSPFPGTDLPSQRALPFGYAVVKRFLDAAGSCILLIALSPLLAAICLWVRLDTPGPAIYRQQRLGRGGRAFTLYKFRTMTMGAPVLPTDQMARQAVSYHTRSGRVLRRASLDELPQLWNVLRGEMSLIGPRPALATQEWLNQGRAARGVHDLRPGITGWAQVRGRDDLPDPEKLEHDAWYRQHCSLALDAAILCKTIATVVTGRGAK